MTITVEVIGLELHGFHGVEEDERRDGQRFVFDLWLEVPAASGQSDHIRDAVDYREVVACVRGPHSSRSMFAFGFIVTVKVVWAGTLTR